MKSLRLDLPSGCELKSAPGLSSSSSGLNKSEPKSFTAAMAGSRAVVLAFRPAALRHDMNNAWRSWNGGRRSVFASVAIFNVESAVAEASTSSSIERVPGDSLLSILLDNGGGEDDKAED